MRHDVQAPRIVLISGMAGTGVSTIAERIRADTASLHMAFDVVDGGSRRAEILDACAPVPAAAVARTRVLAVTTPDIVAITATYALVKLVRGYFPDMPIEVVVNRCDARDALRVYERIQSAATHFLREMVSFGGSIPDTSDLSDSQVPMQAQLGEAAVMAMQDLAARLVEEFDPARVQTLPLLSERRKAS